MKMKKKLSKFLRFFILRAEAKRVPTTVLVNKIYDFCEFYGNRHLFPYQEQFGKRIIRSVLENDGAEITALFARQSGKTETVALIVGGLMIILPILANMPMFADDSRFQMFKQGIWVGIYAPGLRQAQINYNRMRAFLTCPTAIQVLLDDDFRLTFDTNNGNTVSLSNGSYAKAVSASEQSNIEGESYHLIICEEAQDISDYKLTKSIHPMGAAYNATVIDVGTATTFTAYFYRKINQNKEEAKSKSTHIRNHFEYDYLVACKYNERYKKYVEREKKSLGENSDEFQMSYCVAPSTRILTVDLRYIRADEVKVGDKLFAFDEFNEPHRQRNARTAKVEAVGKIIRPCYKLTFDDGTVITCSKEHQWLVQSHGSARRCFWKKTEDLSFNDSFFRIADRWEDLDTGTIRTCKHVERGFGHPKLVKKEYVGLKTVIPIRTDTHTYVAEGIATHNCLKWMLHRGMLIELEKFERENTEPALEVCEYDKSATHVIGIDLGGGEGGDSTVLTAVEVDWSMPVVNESRVDEESGEELTYTAYNTYIKAWLEIRNLPDYEEQYSLIREFISHFRVARVVCDATREKSVSDRLAANLSCEVIPYVFGPKSKSDLYRKFISEIDTGRARVPYGEKTIKSPEYLRFIDQLGSMQKGYSGSYIVCSHPPIKGAHDDYPDSWALAVWGASYEGDTLMVETCDRRKLMELKSETNFQRRVKRLTARRR